MSQLDHLLVDNCAMQLVLNPRALRRARDGEYVRRHPERRGRGAGRLDRHAAFGLDRRQAAFRRVGRACTSRCTARRRTSPGQNKANPLGAIGSVAAMLEYSFGLKEEAAAVNAAMETVLEQRQGDGGSPARRHACDYDARSGEAVVRRDLGS